MGAHPEAGDRAYRGRVEAADDRPRFTRPRHACRGAAPPSGDGVDVTLVEGGGERIVIFPQGAAHAEPRLFVVAGGNESRHRPAAFGDGDRFAFVVDPIDEREALGLELSGGDRFHLTSLSDQFTIVKSMAGTGGLGSASAKRRGAGGSATRR